MKNLSDWKSLSYAFKILHVKKRKSLVHDLSEKYFLEKSEIWICVKWKIHNIDQVQLYFPPIELKKLMEDVKFSNDTIMYNIMVYV